MRIVFTKWLPEMTRKDGHTIKTASENLLESQNRTRQAMYVQT
jgi:hypothetical protein